ncbi:MAG: helix-turn-helix domain-containing protein [Spirulina sp.]
MPRQRIEITERDKQQIEVMAGLGMTVEQIAQVLGISPRTFNRWCESPDVLAHYKKGQDSAQVTIAKSLFEKAKGGDTTAIIWYEKTRAGRRETTQVEVVDERVKEELRDFLAYLRSHLPPDQFTALIDGYQQQSTQRGAKRVPSGRGG